MAKNGLHLITPTSIAYTGTSASISANGSVTLTACTVLSLNGVFSADYDNYLVVADLGTGGNNVAWSRLRASGTDNSTASSYTYQRLYAGSTSIAGDRTSSDKHYLFDIGSNNNNGAVAWFYGPYLAQPTAMRSLSTSDVSSGLHIFDVAGTHNQSTSYDGVTLYPSGNSLSGRVAVYGMRK